MTSKRLVFIVEGDTEIAFVYKHVVPYLCEKGFCDITAQTITTNRKQHKKGGNVSYGKYRNEIKRTLSQGNVIVTSLIDFFKLPTDFPQYTSDSRKISSIEDAISADINNSNFIPYIQKHEIEALMFSDVSGLELVIDNEKQLCLIRDIITDYPNPEDINNSPQTAPSKRLEKIFNYDKVADGELIFGEIDFNKILEKCPRFREWIEKIIRKLKE